MKKDSNTASNNINAVLVEGSVFSNKAEKPSTKKNSFDAFDAILKAVVKYSSKKYPTATKDKGLHTVIRRSGSDMVVVCASEDKNTTGLKNCRCTFHIHAKAFDDSIPEQSLIDDDLDELELADVDGAPKAFVRVPAARIRRVCLEHSCLQNNTITTPSVEGSSPRTITDPSISAITLTGPFQQLHRIVCGLMARPDCAAFRDPVDWKYLGLLDYPEVVKCPMDLGGVRQRLEAGQYATQEEVLRDVRLVWSNCKLYNRDGSEFYFLADKLSKDFEAAYSCVTKLEESQRDPLRMPSLQEKLQLTHDVFLLSNENMLHLLQLAETDCPAALARSARAEEVLLNVDALSPKCFHGVNQFVQTTLLDQTSKLNASKGKKRPLMPIPRTQHVTNTAENTKKNTFEMKKDPLNDNRDELMDCEESSNGVIEMKNEG